MTTTPSGAATPDPLLAACADILIDFPMARHHAEHFAAAVLRIARPVIVEECAAKLAGLNATYFDDTGQPVSWHVPDLLRALADGDKAGET